MFDRISDRYDLMNRIMTLGQDRRWRRLAIEVAAPRPGDRVLDVATGTGDMAVALARQVGPAGSVLGVDISDSMLRVARHKAAGLAVQLRRSDVLELTAQGEFDVASVAFGLRNFSSRELGIERMAAALKSGGRLVVLELTPSDSRLQAPIGFYERRLIPFIARFVAGDPSAYSYLPESVARSLSREQIEVLLRNAGLCEIRSVRLNFGTVAIVSGTKPTTRMRSPVKS